MRFMLATANRHKRREFALILAPHEVLPMPRDVVLPPEGTESFAANARAKARALREAVQGHAVAGRPTGDPPPDSDSRGTRRPTSSSPTTRGSRSRRSAGGPA